MSRILAIDYGRKRCGIAVTDPAMIIATPLITVKTSDLEKFLKEYTEREVVDSFVIGYPKKLNNEPSEMVKYIDPFINRVRKLFPGKEIHLVDERFTSSIAQRAMIEGGMKKKDRQKKGNIDRISASLILQSYLEQQNAKRE